MQAVVYTQTEIDFSPTTVNHPANVEKLTGQNRRLYDWLVAGNSIHIFHPAMQELGIGYLNSRISDLRNKCKVAIASKMVEMNGTHCNVYFIIPF